MDKRIQQILKDLRSEELRRCEFRRWWYSLRIEEFEKNPERILGLGPADPNSEMAILNRILKSTRRQIVYLRNRLRAELAGEYAGGLDDYRALSAKIRDDLDRVESAKVARRKD